jgi:general secretion pathway protein D
MSCLRSPVAAAIVAGAILLQSHQPGWAQIPRPANVKTATATAPASQPDQVYLDFPEAVELQAMADYLSRTLGINILYDESIASKKITVRSPAAIPKDSLLPLFRSVLKIKGLALVACEQPGWYKVVQAQDLPSEVAGLRQEAASSITEESKVLTQVFALKNGDLQGIATTLKPFLSKPGGTMFPIPAQKLLIVTDYDFVVLRLAKLIELLDVAPVPVEVRFFTPSSQPASELAGQVTRILSERAKLSSQGASPLSILAEANLPGMVLIGPTADVNEALALIQRFDVAPKAETATARYTFQHIGADYAQRMIQQLLTDAKPALRLVLDTQGNTLYVTGTTDQHRRVGQVIQDLDSAQPTPTRSVKFYRLLNRRATEVFATLSAMLGQSDLASMLTGEGDSSSGQTGFDAMLKVPGANAPPGRPGIVRQLPEPPALVPPRPPSSMPSGGGQTGTASISGPGYTLAMDEFTNTIIAVAGAAMQEQIQMLIHQLDHRRPQVLVEVTLVSLSDTDALDLGVELQTLRLQGDTLYQLASFFGVTAANTPTNTLTPLHGTGFNGVILRPDECQIVMQALAIHGKSKIISTPRLLVYDNASGKLESVNEQPFTSVNASNTVATTSFAGYSEAGTTLSVEPHIAEGNFLELKYDLSVSDFTGGSAGSTAPPPRNRNTLSSTVVVPDAYTVVVGGLTLENRSDSVSEVPGLGRIPILGLLFQSSHQTQGRSKLYAFIKPGILRDQQFVDLRFLSEGQVQAAGLENKDFPKSVPLWMR